MDKTAPATKKVAQDTSSDETPGRSIYILKSREDILRQAEAFLTNRKWVIRTSVHAHVGLSEIKAGPPDFTMISLNNANSKITMLPKILAQTIAPNRIILFADSLTTVANRILSEVQQEGRYVLYPPISGPAIERLLLKILRDEENALKEMEQNHQLLDASLPKDKDERISISGDAKSRQAIIIQSGQESTQAQADIAIKSGAKNSIIVDKGIATETLVGRSGGPSSTGSSHLDQSSTSGAAKTSSQAAQTPTGQGSVTPAGQSPTASASAQAGPRASSGDQLAQQEKEKPKQGLRSGQSQKEQEKKSNSIFVKGTEFAMQSPTALDRRGSAEPVGPVTTRVACLTVQSSKLSGYLVVACGSDREIDQSFTEAFRDKLTDFMRDQGEDHFKSDDTLDLVIQPTQFQDWAHEQGEFLRKSIHKGNEIAVAFFPGLSSEIPLEISDHEDMLIVKMEQLPEDEIVEFDLYLHMPVNKKFIMHTRNRQPFSQARKEALQKNGVKQLFLRKDAAVGFRRYRVRNFLNSKIAQLKAARAS